ncbi:TraB/GumN family protein [Sphingomonas sp. LB-2]|uniref:TraB/GumN family protein n=1 Tax=Sphingomonas caeni TaxID=2984949 RepID=UPI00222FDFE9|nr:TraB/GumN family protein [Sphingomonas caeni]MCW3848319.1 TraB/GumN family protein [Sphingomonas caeni]
MLKLLRSAVAALTLLLVPVTPAPAQTIRDVDPALWVVKDADTTLYLFGTVHMLKPGLGWFDDGVRAAFDASDELAMEVIAPSDAEMQAIVMRTAFNRDGPTLTMRLPENRRADFARALGSIGMPPQAMDKAKPWFAAMMLGAMPMTRLGYDPALGVEPILTAAARAGGKRLVGLETPEEQFGMFDAAPEEAQIAYLLRVIDQMDKIAPMLDDMLGRWSAGDADGVGELLNLSLAESPMLAKRILFDRNARWADWIEQRLKTPGKVFFAVGGGHLGGPGNVRALLAARGIFARRVAY